MTFSGVLATLFWPRAIKMPSLRAICPSPPSPYRARFPLALTLADVSLAPQTIRRRGGKPTQRVPPTPASPRRIPPSPLPSPQATSNPSGLPHCFSGVDPVCFPAILFRLFCRALRHFKAVFFFKAFQGLLDFFKPLFSKGGPTASGHRTNFCSFLFWIKTFHRKKHVD